MGLKLWVWEEVLTDYSDGAMWALASSAEEAREVVLKAYPHVRQGDLAKEPKAYDEPVGFAIWGGG